MLFEPARVIKPQRVRFRKVPIQAPYPRRRLRIVHYSHQPRPEPAVAEFLQQGGKLVGAGSLCLKAGAAWLVTRNNRKWTQQGPKLVGTGVAFARQGGSVALSTDGNTAVIGEAYDNDTVGATWVFARNNAWMQQGAKLVGTGAARYQGESVTML
jgi:hypothetical protein